MAELRTKREIADDVIKELFASVDRVSIKAALEFGGQRGVSRRTLQRAARAAGVVEIHNGPHPGFWEKQA